MRKTILQIIVLLIAGVVIAWKEWEMDKAAAEIVVNLPANALKADMLTDTQMTIHASLVWLVLLTGILFLLKEWLSKFLGKLSSPNSV